MNECNIPLIDYVKNNNLIHFISQSSLFIYSPVFYNLKNPLKMKLSFNDEIIYFNIEIRKYKNIYYIYTDSLPKVIIKNNEYIKDIKCNLYLIKNEEKLIYNKNLFIFIYYFDDNHYVLFMKPIKLFHNTIKNGKYNVLYKEIIKNDIIWNELIKKQVIEYKKISYIKNEGKLGISYGYLYIIHRYDFMLNNKNVYKIGCTNDINKRIKQYPKGSKLIFSIISKNFRKIETLWINKLKQENEIIFRNDIGYEYFECNHTILIEKLIKIIKKDN